MDKPLKGLPFDATAFREKTAGWKSLSGVPGAAGRVMVEWSVGTGPHCFVYPAAKRTAGLNLTDSLTAAENDERWADFLEFEYIPQIVKALQNEGFRPQVICADLRPLQVQRARRRQIEAAASAKTGRPISLNQQEAEGEGTGQ